MISGCQYPLCFKPVYKDYLWGGSKIIKKYQRDEPDGVYAESWEVSAHPDGESVVENGPARGRTLAELVTEEGSALLGTRATRPDFPLLIKVLDANQTLSVQVHPNNESAARYGGEPKTEMWYVLEADPGAVVYCGLAAGVDEAAYRQAIEQDRFNDLLRTIPVAAGDAVFVPGGRVHAIGSGCLLLECQQNSNTTYRIYDWGRVDAGGQARELHISQAGKVINWQDTASAKVAPELIDEAGGNQRWKVLASPYFAMEKLVLKQAWEDTCDGSTFHILFCAAGTTEVSAGGISTARMAGQSCLLPANCGTYTVNPGDEEAQVMRITLP